MPYLVARTIHRRWQSWHEDAYGPNCRTCASPWMDVCSLIIVCCSRAFWRTSTCLMESLAQLQAEMEQYLHPFEEAMELVQSVVGIDETAAASILAAIGTDMTRFASEKHIASWAGVCPGNKQSGGRRLSGKTTKGNPYLRAILCEVAWAIAHTKDKYLSAFSHRIARRHGKPKAIMALSHKVLVIIYHILRTKKPYADLGAEYFDQRDRGRIERHHIHRASTTRLYCDASAKGGGLRPDTTRQKGFRWRRGA